MNDNALIQQAILAFRQSTGLLFVALPSETEHNIPATAKAGPRDRSYRPDGFAELELANRRLRFVVECKRKVDRVALILQVRHQLSMHASEGLPLLVSHYIGPAMADECQKLGLNFIDAAGNGYLKHEDTLVLVKGYKSRDALSNESMDYRGATSSGALRMIFSLICMPSLLSAPYRTIVEMAGISLGSVGWIFHDLEARGLVTPRDKRKQRHFLDLPRLQDEWTNNYPAKLRVRLNARRFSAPDPNWWRQALGDTEDFLWGGEVAAYILDGHLKPTTQTLYLRHGSGGSTNRLAGRYRLRADNEGPIEILEPFWNFAERHSAKGTVPPLLVYADLMATLDPRAIEAAELLKRNHIDGTERQG